MLSDKIESILEKEVTRKQFLAIFGLGILSLTSMSSFIEMINKQTKHKTATPNYSDHTYGTSASLPAQKHPKARIVSG
ncbi:MAG: hypothetical protein WCO19_01060 [Candidatus Saccharibacteria bacterium]